MAVHVDINNCIWETDNSGNSIVLTPTASIGVTNPYQREGVLGLFRLDVTERQITWLLTLPIRNVVKKRDSW